MKCSRRFLAWPVVALAAFDACQSSIPVDPGVLSSTPIVVMVNANQTFQTIEGWGISMRLFTDPHIIGLLQDDPNNSLRIPASAQAEILDSLYRGIGLTRVRPGPDPGGIEPVNDNDDPFNTDLTKFDFSGRNNDAFLNLTADLRKLGMTHWWLSPIQLEPFMNESNPDEYVEWAMAINRRWRDAGLELPYYSIANEPTGLGAPVSDADYMREVVKRLGHRLRAEGFSTRIVIPDNVSPSTSASFAQTILADPDARQYVAAIAYHLYGEPITNSAALKDLSAQYGIPLWMSEYFTRDWMEWAMIVHSLLVDYNVSVVDYLAGFLGDASGSEALISLLHTGTTYNGYMMQPHYYAYGNFTKYVRPGAVRVATSSPDEHVLVSGFLRAGHLTLVAINRHETDVTVRFDLSGAPSSTPFSLVRTTESDHLRSAGTARLVNGSVTVPLKASSITTLYQ
jgi:hypothetical protein